MLRAVPWKYEKPTNSTTKWGRRNLLNVLGNCEHAHDVVQCADESFHWYHYQVHLDPTIPERGSLPCKSKDLMPF
jgi:hypothetical protein